MIGNGILVYATSNREFFASYTLGGFGNVRMDNDGSANAVVSEMYT